MIEIIGVKLQNTDNLSFGQWSHVRHHAALPILLLIKNIVIPRQYDLVEL